MTKARKFCYIVVEITRGTDQATLSFEEAEGGLGILLKGGLVPLQEIQELAKALGGVPLYIRGTPTSSYLRFRPIEKEEDIGGHLDKSWLNQQDTPETQERVEIISPKISPGQFQFRAAHCPECFESCGDIIVGNNIRYVCKACGFDFKVEEGSGFFKNGGWPTRTLERHGEGEFINLNKRRPMETEKKIKVILDWANRTDRAFGVLYLEFLMEHLKKTGCLPSIDEATLDDILRRSGINELMY